MSSQSAPLLAADAALLALYKRNEPEGFRRIVEGAKCGAAGLLPTLWSLPSRGAEGETWLRMLRLGRDFLEAEFGAQPPELFLPGAARIPESLPQMLSRAGIERLFLPALPHSVLATGAFDGLAWEGLNGDRVTVQPLPKAARLCLTPQELLTALDEAGFSTLPTVSRIPIGPPASPTVWIGPLDSDDEPDAAGKRPSAPGEGDLIEAEFLSLFAGLQREAEIAQEWADRFSSAGGRSASTAIADLVEAGMAALGEQVNTRGLRRPILVVNSLTHFANEPVETPIAAGEAPMAAIGPEGNPVAVQELRTEAGRRSVLFIPKNVPLHGYSVWDLDTTMTPMLDMDTVSASAGHLENDSLLVEFAPQGWITRLFDKDAEREVMLPAYTLSAQGDRAEFLPERCGNRIVSASAATAEEALPPEVLEAGPVRGALRFRSRWNGMLLTQTVRLFADSLRLEIVTEWENEGAPRSLEIGFPVAILSRHAAYAVAFGRTELPTFRNPGGEAPPYTACRWVDLCEGDYGVALLQSGGECRAAGSALHFRLEATAGRGSARCALLPHVGDFRAGEVIDQAAALVRPPRARPVTGNRQGELPPERSLVEVDTASVNIESVRRDGNAVVVRLLEACGARGPVVLTTSLPVKRAFRVDLRGDRVEDLPLAGREATFALQPFEIATVRYLL